MRCSSNVEANRLMNVFQDFQPILVWDESNNSRIRQAATLNDLLSLCCEQQGNFCIDVIEEKCIPLTLLSMQGLNPCPIEFSVARFKKVDIDPWCSPFSGDRNGPGVLVVVSDPDGKSRAIFVNGMEQRSHPSTISDSFVHGTTLKVRMYKRWVPIDCTPIPHLPDGQITATRDDIVRFSFRSGYVPSKGEIDSVCQRFGFPSLPKDEIPPKANLTNELNTTNQSSIVANCVIL